MVLINKRPLRQCKRLGCRELTRSKAGYCDEHVKDAQETKATRNKYYDKYTRNKRDKKYTDFYNSGAWRTVREYVLTNYLGLDVYAYYIDNKIEHANAVHHIVEIKDDWDLRLSVSNLIPLTESSHNKMDSLYKKDKKGTQKLLRELLDRFQREYGVSPLP